jgi:hypothetical protein
MKRIAAQLVVVDAGVLCRNLVIEQDENQTISKLIDLSTQNVETSGTIFHNGILSPEFFSLVPFVDLQTSDYLKYDIYVYSEGSFKLHQKGNSDKLIIDCGTDNPNIINQILTENYSFFIQFDLITIIEALTINPALAAGKTNYLKPGYNSKIMLWENCDLVNFKITPSLKLL